MQRRFFHPMQCVLFRRPARVPPLTSPDVSLSSLSLSLSTAKPVRPKQLPVCSPTNPFYTYVRASEHGNAYSNALFQSALSQKAAAATITSNPNSVQSNT